MNMRNPIVRRAATLLLAAAMMLCPVTALAADGVTGNENISAVYDPNIMNGSGTVNFPVFKEINSDVKAWLRIPGTNINQPVLYDNRILSNNGSNIHYYLNRDLYQNVSKLGVIYADPAVRFGKSSEISRNTVLFGHNWTNYTTTPWVGRSTDQMFAQLVSYHYLNFAKSHPYIYYSTEDAEMTWVVFAAFYTDIGFNYITANPTDEHFAEIVRGAIARSEHNFDVEVAYTDKILTLSTCTRMFGPSNKQRFVVMARLLRDGEDTSKGITITANPNPVRPTL